jgi:hypothetical protein
VTIRSRNLTSVDQVEDIPNGCCPRALTLGTNDEHQFYVIQTEFISPENPEFTSVSKKYYFPSAAGIVRLDNGSRLESLSVAAGS